MRTPLKPGIDNEIYELEERLQRRRAEIPRVARAAGRGALDKVASPKGLAAAVAVGFIVGGGLRRTKYVPERRERERRQEMPKKKGVAVGSLLMSAAIALIRAQYGSPFGMAKALLEKFQGRKVPASPQADIRTARRVAG